MILNPNSAKNDSLDKADPFLPMLLNRPNISTQMEVIINDTGKKAKTSPIGGSLIQLWMHPYIKTFMTRMESGFLDPIKVEREAL